MADVMELIKQHEADMIGIRRHIHANPELSNEENRTTALIREKLEEYGIEIMEIGLKTGVVGFLKGGRPGKTVAIREDIDALPMSEKNGSSVCLLCGRRLPFLRTRYPYHSPPVLCQDPFGTPESAERKCTVPIPAGGGARHWGQAASGL